uniref:sensor histidine kinase n=1 Tax=Horticoccus sp. 23ND18S-11 TaxID=3391832 RepID=UPI0039C99732
MIAARVARGWRAAAGAWRARCRAFGIVAAGVFAGSGATLSAAEVTSVSALLAMPSEQAARGDPLTLRGTVTFVEPGLVFLQDDTAGTYFRPHDAVAVVPGDELEVVGRTEAGIYLPGIESRSHRLLGRRPLPAAIDASYEDLLSGRFHYQRVALTGMVRSLSALSEGRSLLRLALGTRVVDVWVESPLQRERVLVDSLVRAQGLAVGAINSRRQLVQPYVRALDWTEIVTVRPAPPQDAVPRIAASELLTYGLARQGGGRVRVVGSVMAAFSRGMLYLRSDKAAIGVRLATHVPLQIGEVVEVLGFPEMGRFTASLVDAQLVERRPGPEPAPIALNIEDLFRGSYDSDLVEVTAKVTDSFRSDRDHTLVLQQNERRVRVSLLDLNLDVPAGSRVRVTGISRVNVSEGVGYSSQPEAISIYVRSPDDLEILQRPSGWTVRRLTLISAGLGGVMLLAVLWIALLRRQVSAQAAAALRRIEAEVALEERQRLARDVHDTLEQELVGLGLRLDAVTTREFDEKGRTLIEASRSLVSRIQSEMRNLVGELRQPGGHVGDLGAALADLRELNDAEGGCEVRIAMQPEVPLLPVAAVHNLRMIARESVTNALKHAAARLIEVSVALRQGTTLVLTVTDNGRGFDAARETRGKSGHYGCVGIRERSAKLGAHISWRSAPGAGTTVELTLALAALEPKASRPDSRPLDPAPATTPERRVTVS